MQKEHHIIKMKLEHKILRTIQKLHEEEVRAEQGEPRPVRFHALCRRYCKLADRYEKQYHTYYNPITNVGVAYGYIE